ncbi:restriction endonuclease subunit S [Propioniciclava sp. MC1683]|uniref:restriction endonuclease subunit S n=1 Tax=Propioniciclava sp. MC1683 TaxID=2760309 RepID=UPI001C7279FF|nr:restriction endonuclease subunit S [Propioniciclava sp. MC1683]
MIIPPGWTIARLDQVADWSSGGTPKAGRRAYYGGDIPWAVIGDLADGAVRATANSITQLGLENSSAKIVPAGSVLVAMYGSIGKLGVAGLPMATNQAIAIAQPREGISREFLFYYLMSQRDLLNAAGRGGTQRNISQSILKPWPIPLPPPDEQCRVVEIIEDHLSRLDAADGGISTALARVRALEEQIIRSALVDATSTMHRPTPELPNVGTDDSTIVPLPPGWRWVRLDDVADVVGGVTKDSKKQADPSLVEVPYLRVANVQRGRLDLSEIATIRVTAQKAQALELRVGDVLLNEGGDRDKLARGWVWEGQIPGCIHQNHVFRARIKTDLDPYFLSLTANTFGSPWAMRNGKQSVNLASISQTVIRKMPVILPPSGESGRIAARVTEQLDTNGRLREELLAARRRSATLRRAVLAAAFSGRLTGAASDSDLIEQQAPELDEAVHASTEVRADEQIPLEAPHPG